MVATHSRPRMTPTEARSFDRFSVANASYVKHSLACGCEPYQDVFTYNRWKALGYQVQRGEKAITIPVVKAIQVDNKETGEPETRKLFGSGAVFCRHQVQPVNGSKATPAVAPVVAPTPATIPAQPPAPTGFVSQVMNTWKEVS